MPHWFLSLALAALCTASQTRGLHRRLREDRPGAELVMERPGETSAPTPLPLPTTAPTSSPTIAPSDGPSDTPSSTPSIAPTTSFQPSVSTAPSTVPTNGPTAPPTRGVYTTAALDPFVMVLSSPVSTGELAETMELYFLANMDYESLESIQLDAERGRRLRVLQTSEVALDGWAIFAGSDIPSDLYATQVFLLSDLAAIQSAVNENPALAGVLVESVSLSTLNRSNGSGSGSGPLIGGVLAASAVTLAIAGLVYRRRASRGVPPPPRGGYAIELDPDHDDRSQEPASLDVEIEDVGGRSLLITSRPSFEETKDVEMKRHPSYGPKMDGVVEQADDLSVTSSMDGFSLVSKLVPKPFQRTTTPESYHSDKELTATPGDDSITASGAALSGVRDDNPYVEDPSETGTVVDDESAMLFQDIFRKQVTSGSINEATPGSSSTLATPGSSAKKSVFMNRYLAAVSPPPAPEEKSAHFSPLAVAKPSRHAAEPISPVAKRETLAISPPARPSESLAYRDKPMEVCISASEDDDEDDALRLAVSPTSKPFDEPDKILLATGELATPVSSFAKVTPGSSARKSPKAAKRVAL